jgi:SAM-dependent methyltransferase
MPADRIRARVFGEAADLYERRRPGYPSALYEDLLALVDRAEWALEAGAGTGKATVELARRGFAVVALEPDREMAALARRATEGLSVDIDERSFEEWHGEVGTFDLVASAQAWHWIDPDRGAAVARRALRPSGVLAVWWNQAGEWDGPVRDALDAAYRRHAPGLMRSVVNSPLHGLARDAVAIDGFKTMVPRSYTWERRYDAIAYSELLQTHSEHRLLPPDQLGGLLRAVTDVIERVGGGEIAYPYRTDLLTARRADSG